VGLEPTNPLGYRDLNPARFPNFATAADDFSTIGKTPEISGYSKDL
jgi:hypothetical protein